MLDGLDAVIDEIAATDLRFASDDELEAAVGDLSRGVSRLQGQIARRADEAKRRQSHLRHGLSLTRWLALHGDFTNAEARSLIGLATTTTSHPDTGRAVWSGVVLHSRARIMSRAAQAHPKLFERDEAMLLGFARELPISHLNHALRRWRHCADDAMAEGRRRRPAGAAYLNASVTWAGMVRLDGLLDPTTGEAVLAAGCRHPATRRRRRTPGVEPTCRGVGGDLRAVAAQRHHRRRPARRGDPHRRPRHPGRSPREAL